MEIHSETRQESVCGTHGGEEPIWSPAPVTKDGINEARYADGIKNIAGEPRAAYHCARADCRCAVCKSKLEQIVSKDRDPRGCIGGEHAYVFHEEQAFAWIARQVPSDEWIAFAEHKCK